MKTQLLLLPEIGRFYGLDGRMQILDIIALFQRLDLIKKTLLKEVVRLVKLIIIM